MAAGPAAGDAAGGPVVHVFDTAVVVVGVETSFVVAVAAVNGPLDTAAADGSVAGLVVEC